MIIVEAGFFKEALDKRGFEAYVIIDVLRFTTTVSLALAAGAEKVVFYSDYNDALEYSRRNCTPLAAEIEGFKPPSADYDNSPVEVYLAVKDYGYKEIVVRSTSGAYLLEEAFRRKLENVYLASIVNAEAVARRVACEGYKSVCIVMAGFRRRFFALDDMMGAGSFINELMRIRGVKLLNDEAKAAVALWRYYRSRLLEALMNTRAGRMLVETGRSYDVEVSCRLNSVSSTPKLSLNWRYVIESR